MYDVSVIVPCYNKENSLQKTLDSLIKQTIFNRMEIICIDDCSTDNTYNKILLYTKKYNNIKLIKHEKNSSVFVARKTGIINAKGKYVGWVDPDDWVEPTYFEEMMKNCKVGDSYVDILINYNVWKYFSEDKMEFYSDIHKNNNDNVNNVITVDDNDNGVEYYCNNWLFLWNKMFKRTTLNYITYLPNYYINYSEDYLIAMIAYLESKVVKTFQSNAKLFYNLSDEVSHLSRSPNYILRDQSYAKTMHIVDSYMLEFNKMRYKCVIDRMRRKSLNSLTQQLGKIFSSNKCSDNTEKYTNIITVNDRINEIATINNYIKLFTFGNTF